MVKIENMPMPENMYSIKCPYSMNPTRIVIHNTANSAPAENEIKYMQRNDKQVSFHYAVDDKKAILGSPLNRNTWHASDGNGKGNREGISIEICYSLLDKDKAKFEKAQENAAELTAYLLNKYGWGMDKSRITKHQDYGNHKYCPHRTLSDYGWDYFLQLVEKKYNEMYVKGDKPMTAEEKNQFDELKAKVEQLSKSVETTTEKYNWISMCPQYSRETIQKLYEKQYLKGDENGQLKLSEQMTRVFVILDRAGLFD